MKTRRRDFLRISGTAMASAFFASPALPRYKPMEFEISLVESSFKRLLTEGRIHHLDLAHVAKQEFGIDAIEYVSTYFPNQRPPEPEYIDELNRCAAEHRVRQLLIHIDADIRVGSEDAEEREQAVASVEQWVEVAKLLGCHSVQLNAIAAGDAETRLTRIVPALKRLSRFARDKRINLLLGGDKDLIEEAEWLIQVVETVNEDNCCLLTRICRIESPDKRQSLAQLVPYSKGISADMDARVMDERDSTAEFEQAIRVVHDAGYRGYIGVNYCGEADEKRDEKQGVASAIRILQQLRDAK